MKSFVFLNRKGGTGKTSVSVTCAIELARLGFKTVLADCDPQGNSSSWLSKDFKYELSDVTYCPPCELNERLSIALHINPSVIELVIHCKSEEAEREAISSGKRSTCLSAPRAVCL